MKHEDKFPLIDAFLMHRISDEEGQELKQLRKNTEFEEEFLFRKNLYEASKLGGRRALKNRFGQLDSRAKVKPLKKWWIAASVAAVGLLILASTFLLKPSSSEALYSEHYSKLINKVVPITRGEDNPDNLKIGFINYQRGDYEQAKSIFNEELEDNGQIAIYLGIIAMEEKDFEQAVSILDPIAQDPSLHFSEDAKWYLALSYLAQDNRDRTRKILQEITKSKSRSVLRASELLKQIKD